jgi:hypothetical protein
MGRALRYLPLVGASLCVLLATVSIWMQRQLLDTDTWTETSTELLQDEVVRDAVSVFLVNQLYAHVDVAKQLERTLPGETKKLSGPIAGALRTLAERQADDALAQPPVQSLWEEANRTSHEELVDFLEGDSDALVAEQGQVTLDLRMLVRRVGQRVGLRDLDRRLPEQAAEVRLASSDELDAAQDAVVVLNGLALTTAILTLLLYALHVWLAEGRRRQAVREAGISLIGVGIAVLVLRELGGRAVVDGLAETASVKPAAERTWAIGTELLASQARGLILYGAVAIAGSLLAGPSRIARGMRRAVAPWAGQPAIAYTAFALAVLGILIWAPTEATTRVLSALVVIAILAIGFEALRRQIEREWPDAEDPDWSALWRETRDGIASFFAGARRTIAGIGDRGGDEQERRLGQLERLGRLKESGVLTAREFSAEKERILSG